MAIEALLSLALSGSRNRRRSPRIMAWHREEGFTRSSADPGVVPQAAPKRCLNVRKALQPTTSQTGGFARTRMLDSLWITLWIFCWLQWFRHDKGVLTQSGNIM
jgi:hypothetical protein